MPKANRWGKRGRKGDWGGRWEKQRFAFTFLRIQTSMYRVQEPCQVAKTMGSSYTSAWGKLFCCIETRKQCKEVQLHATDQNFLPLGPHLVSPSDDRKEKRWKIWCDSQSYTKFSQTIQTDRIFIDGSYRWTSWIWWIKLKSWISSYAIDGFGKFCDRSLFYLVEQHWWNRKLTDGNNISQGRHVHIQYTQRHIAPRRHKAHSQCKSVKNEQKNFIIELYCYPMPTISLLRDTVIAVPIL